MQPIDEQQKTKLFTQDEKERLESVDSSLLMPTENGWMVRSIFRTTDIVPGEVYCGDVSGISPFGDRRLIYFDSLPFAFKELDELIDWFVNDNMFVTSQIVKFINAFGVSALIALRLDGSGRYSGIEVEDSGYIVVQCAFFNVEEKIITVEYCWY